MLTSRHYKILQAVYDTLTADTDLTAEIPEGRWNVQKKPWHRGQTWKSGGHIAAVRRVAIPHENKVLRYTMPVIVVVVWPNNVELTTSHETRLGAQERIEDIFNLQGRTTSAAPMLALDNALTGNSKFTFEQSRVQPGEAFIEAAFQDGLDAMATMIEVDIIACKVDYSSLGA